MAVSSTKSLFFGAVLGAVAAYYFAPDRGRSRRSQHRDRVLSTTRRVTRDVEQRGRYTEGKLEGVRARSDGKGEFTPEDDIDIKQGIQQRLSQLNFEVNDIVIDVTDGVAGLRGQVKTPEEQNAAELAVADVAGVQQVDSWLHLPGQPAPNKAEARRVG